MNESVAGPKPASPEGLLVVDKPAGMTSHDVIDVIRGKLHTRKVGHAGTLDPDATGLLVVGVGRATRLLAYAQMGSKRYRARARFGISTTTQDSSGEVVERRDPDFSRPDLEEVLAGFVGKIEQVPPMVSALKVRGERLYEKARRGEEVERAPRRVTVHSLALLEVMPDDGSPAEAILEVECSGGTYVRTLVHDIGEALGCGAHLAELRRTGSGPFTESDAVALTEVDAASLRPLRDAVGALPVVEVDAAGAEAVRHGRALEPAGDAEGLVALVRDDTLLAVYRREGDRLVAETVVAAA